MDTRMLWYKAWLDTRWRFLIGLCVLAFAAAGCVLAYPRAMQVLAAVGHSDEAVTAIVGSSPVARENIALTLQLAGTYRGFIWSQLFHNELPQLWCLFAIVIGSGGIVSQASRGEGLFTLSLPVSRHALVTARVGVALAELLALALIPALVVTMVSPAIGQTYSPAEALVHGALLFTGGAVFFCITFLLSTFFTDIWRPPLIMVAIFFIILTLRTLSPELTRFTLAPVITGEAFFWGRSLPWGALSVSVAASVALLFLAARNIARRDF